MDKKHFITDIYDADFDPVVPPRIQGMAETLAFVYGRML